MKAIIWKELRENAKWAVLMLLGLAGAMVWELSPGIWSSPSLVSPEIIEVTTIGCLAIGFTLGLLQGLQDCGTGRWGFLTHRPISRSRIFFAKVLAGVCLYFLATMIPLAGAVYWVATPGHSAAPFAWHMILPRLADLLGGLMWYAAGLLVAARRARWIGSRLMPAGMMVFCAIAAFAVPMNFAQAMLVFAVALAIVLPAAWGAFVKGGDFDLQPLVARIMTGLCIGAGLFCALVPGAEIVKEMLSPYDRSGQTNTNTYYQIGEDARVLIVTQKWGVTERVTDLQGNPMPNELATGSAGGPWVSLSDISPEKMPAVERRDYWGFQRETRYLRVFNIFGSIQWYYVAQRRTIEGFDRAGQQFVGSLGPNGFVPPGQTAQPFAEPLYGFEASGKSPTLGDTDVIAASAKAVYHIDLVHQTVAVLFVADAADTIVNVSADVAGGQVNNLVVVTRSAIRMINRGGTEYFHTALEHASPQAEMVMMHRTASAGYILIYQTDRRDKGPWGWIVEMNVQGGIIHETELPNLPVTITPDRWWADAPMLLVYPPGLLPARLWIMSRWIPDPVEHREVLAAMVIAVIGVLLTCLSLRRVPASRAAKGWWLVLNALLGFPGALLLLSLRQRVAAAACPACGKCRLVTGEHCEHCQAPFNAPAAQGIEVFE